MMSVPGGSPGSTPRSTNRRMVLAGSSLSWKMISIR
jgi:hypothetical protein